MECEAKTRKVIQILCKQSLPNRGDNDTIDFEKLSTNFAPILPTLNITNNNKPFNEDVMTKIDVTPNGL